MEFNYCENHLISEQLCMHALWFILFLKWQISNKMYIVHFVDLLILLLTNVTESVPEKHNVSLTILIVVADKL